MSSDPTTTPRNSSASGMTVRFIHRTEVEHFGDVEYLSTPCSTWDYVGSASVISVGTTGAVEPTESQNVQQERLVGAIAQRIRHTLNLDELVQIAAQHLGELLQVDRVEIVQFLPQLGVWRYVAEYCRDLDTISLLDLDVPDQENPFSAQLQRFEIVQTGSTSNENTQLSPSFARFLLGCWLLIPLKIKGLWGYLSLMQQRSQEWQSEEIELIQAAVEQLRIAIEHSQLYAHVQQVNQQLEQIVKTRTQQLSQVLANESMLKRVTDKVRDSLDEAQILETIVEELATLLKLDYCDTGLYDIHRNTCTIAYDHTGAFPSAQGLIIDMSVVYPDVYGQLLNGQTVQFCLQPKEDVSDFFGHTILACPISDNQGVLGDLWLFRSAEQAFNELEVRLVQQVTNQCAIAIRQARLYQAAQNQVESLEHINQLKDTFLSTVSHELRTPISTIKMAIQMLTLTLGREGLLPDPYKPSLSSTKIAHYLKILNDECNREIGLITDLLDLQQLEAGTHTLTIQSIELSSYLQRIARPFQEQANEQGQILEVEVESNLPNVRSDPQSLERILVELLTNACKYTPAGEKIQLSVQVVKPSEGSVQNEPHLSHRTAHRQTQSAFIRIAVTNSGVEIAPDQLGQVFDKFYRVPNSDPHRHSGTGLGLALVKKLAPQIGGRVFATSEHGQTCFAIELPAVLLEG